MKIGFEIKTIRELLNLTHTELANKLNVTFEIVNSWENDTLEIEKSNLEKLYNFAYCRNIFLNKMIVELLHQKFNYDNFKLLFHVPKKSFTLPINLNLTKPNNDFGYGFYLSETFEEATTYFSISDSSETLSFQLDLNDLQVCKFNVNLEWILAVAYFRGWLKDYKDHPTIKNIIKNIENVDVIISPIADNRMYNLISEFIEGEITNLQCEHALKEMSLGFQYVLKTEKALNNLMLLKEFHVSELEKVEFFAKREEMHSVEINKVKLARIEFKDKGKYIDEVLV